MLPLLLFKSLGKGKPVRFINQFHCASWEFANGKDREQNPRKLIVFHLISTDQPLPAEIANGQTSKGISFDELRRRAYEAASQSPQGKSKKAKPDRPHQNFTPRRGDGRSGPGGRTGRDNGPGNRCASARTVRPQIGRGR